MSLAATYQSPLFSQLESQISDLRSQISNLRSQIQPAATACPLLLSPDAKADLRSGNPSNTPPAPFHPDQDQPRQSQPPRAIVDQTVDSPPQSAPLRH